MSFIIVMLGSKANKSRKWGGEAYKCKRGIHKSIHDNYNGGYPYRYVTFWQLHENVLSLSVVVGKVEF